MAIISEVDMIALEQMNATELRRQWSRRLRSMFSDNGHWWHKATESRKKKKKQHRRLASRSTFLFIDFFLTLYPYHHSFYLSRSKIKEYNGQECSRKRNEAQPCKASSNSLRTCFWCADSKTFCKAAGACLSAKASARWEEDEQGRCYSDG